MYSIRRPTSFLSLQDWINDTEWDDRLQAILDQVPLGPALAALPTPARTGRPEQHDRTAMLRAYVAKAVEQIPTTEALRARLRRDPVFRWIVGYRGKSDVPSAAACSRMFDPLSRGTSVQAVHAQQVETARQRQVVPPMTPRMSQGMKSRVGMPTRQIRNARAGG